jgi:hypothetical protein
LRQTIPSRDLATCGKVRAPAIGEHEPGSEAAPRFHVLAAVGDDGAIGLADADGVAADLHGHVAGGIDADGFEAEVFVSGVAELTEQVLNVLRAVSRLEMRSHECAILREKGGSLIVVAGVEGGDEVLSDIAEQGLNIEKGTGFSQGT